MGKLSVPRLAAIEVGGSPRVFFSREDLSAGLMAAPVDGIVGYDPDTATAIVRNVLVFAETGGKGFPPPPKDKDAKEKDGKDKPNQAESPADKPAAKEDAPPESNRPGRAAPPARQQRRTPPARR